MNRMTVHRVIFLSIFHYAVSFSPSDDLTLRNPVGEKSRIRPGNSFQYSQNTVLVLLAALLGSTKSRTLNFPNQELTSDI